MFLLRSTFIVTDSKATGRHQQVCSVFLRLRLALERSNLTRINANHEVVAVIVDFGEPMARAAHHRRGESFWGPAWNKADCTHATWRVRSRKIKELNARGPKQWS